MALRGTGARRLLTPAELAAKTLALTGFQWGRRRPGPWVALWNEQKGVLTDPVDGYGLLYGGIDADGVTDRARDITSVMAGVAQTHAFETSCPVILREFYLLPEEDRRLFAGIDQSISPVSEFAETFEIEAASREERETVSSGGRLTAGEATVTLAFTNNEAGEDPVDRNLRLDRLEVRDAQGGAVASRELEELSSAAGCEWNGAEDDHFAFYCNGTLDVPVTIPADGQYTFEVVAWADQNPKELAKLELGVGTDSNRSAGGQAIRAKLSELYGALHGVELEADSEEVSGAYELFVDLWERKRDLAVNNGDHFLWYENDVRCEWDSDQYYLEGIADHLWRDKLNEDGNPLGWDWDGIHAYFEGLGLDDREGVARTWSVVLAYLLMDYGYLYL